MDRRAIKVRTGPSREDGLSAIKMTLIRFNTFVQEMDSQHCYSPKKFTAEQRAFRGAGKDSSNRNLINFWRTKLIKSVQLAGQPY